MFQKGTKWRSERVSKRAENDGPHKNEQNVVSYTICNVSAMSTMFKNSCFGDYFGSPEWVPREVNERSPPKHTSQGALGHLGGPKVILGFPEGFHLAAKSFKTESWKTCPVPWSAKVVPRWPPRGPKVPELTQNSVLN